MGLLLRRFRCRLLMPRVRPFQDLALLIPIPLLHLPDKRVVDTSDLLQVVIGKLAPLLFQLAFELQPLPLELISVYRHLLLYRD